MLRNYEAALALVSSVIKFLFTGSGICIKWWEILVDAVRLKFLVRSPHLLRNNEI